MTMYLDEIHEGDSVYTTDGPLGTVSCVERHLRLFDQGIQDPYIVVHTEERGGEDLYIPVKYIKSVNPANRRIDLDLSRADLEGEVWRTPPDQLSEAA